jgi:hypothetical protein
VNKFEEKIIRRIPVSGVKSEIAADSLRSAHNRKSATSESLHLYLSFDPLTIRSVYNLHIRVRSEPQIWIRTENGLEEPHFDHARLVSLLNKRRTAYLLLPVENVYDPRAHQRPFSVSL